jgi:hypothetical protein
LMLFRSRLSFALIAAALAACGAETAVDPAIDPDIDPAPARDVARVVEEPTAALPVIAIDTGGTYIEHDVKIPATMYIVEDHDGTLDDIASRPRSYEGAIEIEGRGNSSASNPKQSYGVETHGDDGDAADVALLGLPAESDWVLYAPYNDKTLLRDKLAYDLGRTLGRYAPRSRFVEVVLNGDYVGVYVLLEKIKRSKHRVDLPKVAARAADGDITGGYIIKREGGGDWDENGQPAGIQSRRGTPWDFHEPKRSKITAEQRAYLQQYIDDFEDAMEPDDGFADRYPERIDVASFVDVVVVTELSRNVDGYRKSAYFAKDRDRDGGRLHAGPIWDYNLAFGNADYCGAEQTSGFQFERDPEIRGCYDEEEVAPWWKQLAEDPAFARAVRCRWEALRQGVLADDALVTRIDGYAAQLAVAEPRDNAVWQTLGVCMWPNPVCPDTYAGEIEYLQGWLRDRAAWLDENLPGSCD